MATTDWLISFCWKENWNNARAIFPAVEYFFNATIFVKKIDNKYINKAACQANSVFNEVPVTVKAHPDLCGPV